MRLFCKIGTIVSVLGIGVQFLLKFYGSEIMQLPLLFCEAGAPLCYEV
jgi:hypothetical protein